MDSMLIAHVWDIITETLSFEDLLNCILVSRQCSGQDQRQTPTPGPTLIHKHTQHFRAITCQGNQSLQLLQYANCNSLVEINYVTDPDAPEMGYLALCSDLILKTPELSAISVEGIQYSQPAVAALDQFLDILEKYPQITCVYSGR
ncbi:hypothetical protein MVEG_07214 [Podila verticillata NRRL 6337]|nr:hypothetical protein MVEG_07214 [Podila verticillata NRRL 6337]